MRSVRFVTDPGELVEVTLKPNYRRLGPRFGAGMPAVAAAVAALPPAETARALDAGGTVEIVVDGAPAVLDSDDLLREARPSEGYAVGQDAALAVGLATEITHELRLEALAREIVHAVQGARRTAGLRVEERIAPAPRRLGPDPRGDRRPPPRDRRRDARDEHLRQPRGPLRGPPPRGDDPRRRAFRPAARPGGPAGVIARRLRRARAGSGRARPTVALDVPSAGFRVGALGAPDGAGRPPSDLDPSGPPVLR